MNYSRRAFLQAAGGAALTLPVAGWIPSLPAGTAGARRRVGRVAHVTDTHAIWAAGAYDNIEEELAAFFWTLDNLADPPNLILHTGDIINDALEATKLSALQQVELWNRVQSTSSTPIRYAPGNHDKYGWARSPLPIEDPLYGTAFFTAHFEPQRHYSFDQMGWRFIVLDSAFGRPPRTSDARGVILEYMGKLDEQQFQWLEMTLSSTPISTPVVVLSHIPIVTSTVFTLAFWGSDYSEADKRILVRDSAMHADHRRILNLFDPTTGGDLVSSRPKVKLCLAGHNHLFDHINYQDRIHFMTGPAVCGYWWYGNRSHYQTPPGFGLLDLYDDGTFEYTVVSAPLKPSGVFSWIPSITGVATGLVHR